MSSTAALHSNLLALVLAMTSLAGPAEGLAQAPPPARATVERAAGLMGGEETLRGIRTVRFDMMTQWQRTGFRDVPWTDRPSFERHTDVRDYTIPAWRNTRMFTNRNITNIIRDTVAITDFGTGFQPLSVAYVDERDELFLYTPDRLILALLDADRLSAAPDTAIGGEAHHVVRATVDDGLPVSVYFHAGSGLPTLLRFHAAQPNDFGLVPWGDMPVDVWYSNWQSTGALSIPTQWDIERVGRPYKRMTAQSLAINPEFAPDSFAVSADLRSRYIETRGPMHDRQPDSVAVVAPGLVQVTGFGFPAGAVRGGNGWYLLEAAHHPLMLERARRGLRDAGVDGIAGAIIVAARAGNGGVVALADEGVPLFISPAAEPFVRTMLDDAGRSGASFDVIRNVRRIGNGREAVQVAPVDLADVPGSLLVYSESLGWLYAPDAATAIDVRLVEERARSLGWTWTALGTARGLVVEGAPSGSG